ncbi:MAG TPA: hypothetical protein PKX78_04250 [Candidatus Woesebacteria bacterium]|nr:hypothetical protein [Candidatus Woesebacteria bacterium]
MSKFPEFGLPFVEEALKPVSDVKPGSRLSRGESLADQPLWLTDLSTIMSKSRMLLFHLDATDLSFGQDKNIADFNPILKSLGEINLRKIFGSKYTFEPTVSPIDTTKYFAVRKPGGYIQFVQEEIYRPLKKVVGHLQNGEYRSANPEYIYFFAQISGIVRKLEDLLFE